MPAFRRKVDISLLFLFCSAAQKDNQVISILAEIDPVARTKIDCILEHPRPNSLCIRKVSLFHANDRSSHFSRRRWMQISKPLLKGTPSVRSFVLFCNGKRETFEDQLPEMVTYVLPLSRSLSEAEGR